MRRDGYIPPDVSKLPGYRAAAPGPLSTRPASAGQPRRVDSSTDRRRSWIDQIRADRAAGGWRQVAQRVPPELGTIPLALAAMILAVFANMLFRSDGIVLS